MVICTYIIDPSRINMRLARASGSRRWRRDGIKQRGVAFRWKFLWIQRHPRGRISRGQKPCDPLLCDRDRRAEDPGPPVFEGVFGAQAQDSFGCSAAGFDIISFSCATDNINSAAVCWCRFGFKNQHAIVRHHSRVSLNNIYMDTYLMRNIYVILCDNCPAIVEIVVCSADLIKPAYDMVQV